MSFLHPIATWWHCVHAPMPRLWGSNFLCDIGDLLLQSIQILANRLKVLGIRNETLVHCDQDLEELAELHLVEVLRAVRVPNLTLRLLVFFVTVCRFFRIPAYRYVILLYRHFPRVHLFFS